MTKTLSTIALLAALVTPALAEPTEAQREQYKACESKYRAQVKAMKAAAPAGFVPAPDRDRRPNFMLNCLATKA